MERPKSAKYNLERYREATNRASKNSTTLDSQLADEDLGNMIEDSPPPPPHQFTREERMQASKSAFVVRPQSARHNLAKYRQDVLNERQRKLEQLNHEYNNNNSNQISSNTMTTTTTTLTTPRDNNTDGDDDDDDDNDVDYENNDLLIDDDDKDLNRLEALQVRDDFELESSSEDENNNRDNNLDNNQQPQQRQQQNRVVLTNNKANNNQKLVNGSNKTNGGNDMKKKTKLLNKRNAGAAATTNNQVIKNNNNNNHYTTFRPTAVTTNYSIAPTNNSNNNTIKQSHPSQIKQQQQQQNGGPPSTAQTSMSDYITTRPSIQPTHTTSVPKSASMSTKISTNLHQLNNQQTTNTNQNIDNTTNVNSSSSSSSTTVLTNLDNNTNTNVAQLHLAMNSNNPNNVSRRRRPYDPTVDMDREAAASATGWIRADEAGAVTDELGFILMEQCALPSDAPDAAVFNFRQRQEQQHQFDYELRASRQIGVNRSLNTTSMSQHQAQTGSRTNTRLSDYSQQSMNTRLRSSGGGGAAGTIPVDQWTKRNLVAQNVLMKHRAELEQLAKTSNQQHQTVGGGGDPTQNHRASPNSIQTLATGVPTPNKFLIPESSKYYKK